MSELANKIDGYYKMKLWSIERVEKALELGRITQEEFNQITSNQASV